MKREEQDSLDDDLRLFQAKRVNPESPELSKADERVANAITALVRYFGRSLPPEARDDVAQDVCLRVWRSGSFHGGNSRAYLAAAVKRGVASWTRATKNAAELFAASLQRAQAGRDGAEDFNAGGEVELRALGRRDVSEFTKRAVDPEHMIRALQINDAVARMGEPLSTIVRMYVQLYPYDEIAEMVGLSVKAVEMRVSRLHKTLGVPREARRSRRSQPADSIRSVALDEPPTDRT